MKNWKTLFNYDNGSQLEKQHQEAQLRLVELTEEYETLTEQVKQLKRKRSEK